MTSSKLTALAAIVAFAYGPMLAVFFRQLWSQPQYQFFPFVFAAVAGMLWVRWQEAPEVHGAERKTSTWATGLAAWLMLAAAILVFNPWASMASLIVLAGAGCLVIASRRQVRYLWGIWLLLWLVLPLPLGLDQKLVTHLQLTSSQLSSLLLDMIGVPHLMEGNALLVSGRELFVDEACSGIVSVKSLVACALIYGVWRNRTPLHLVVLAVAGIVWAMLMNVLRITTIAAALHYFGVDWTSGWQHEALSLAVFTISFGCLLSSDVLLQGALKPVLLKWQAHSGTVEGFGTRLAAAWDAFVTWGDPADRGLSEEDASSTSSAERFFPWKTAITAFGLLAAGQFAFLGWAWAHPPVAGVEVADAEAFGEGTLPVRLADMELVAFQAEQRDREDIFGEFSRTYRYRDRAGDAYVVSFDFPFNTGWHELTVCYSGVGWTAASRRISAERPSDPAWTAVEVDLAKLEGEHAYVTWCMFDDQGQSVSPPQGAWQDQLWRLLVRRHPLAPTPQMFQVQVFLASGEPASDTQKSAARALLIAASELLRAKLCGADPAGGAPSPSDPASVTESQPAA